jgi:tRNA pseudouridine32 synthase/23S rRNA pseudouridine746 synthase
MKVYKSKVKKKFTQKISLGDFLLNITPLSKHQLSDVAEKGGVWIQRNSKGKILRIRNLDELVDPEDMIEVYFDQNILDLPRPNSLKCLYEDKNYGVWLKPSSLVSQGSKASDHVSVLRYVEKYKKKEVYLVHRLDRETSGLLIIAYHSKSAAVFSDLFQKNKITKYYEAIVLGEIKIGYTEKIRIPLDNKEAITHFEVISSGNGVSKLSIMIETGRLHQIRRHLELIGHPVLGDPKYGKGNKNKEGLRLIAIKLSFFDPWLKKQQSFNYPSH